MTRIAVWFCLIATAESALAAPGPGCFVVDALEVRLRDGWFAGKDPRDPEEDAFLISPFVEGREEVQIVVTTYPDRGNLDEFAAERERGFAQSPKLRERVVSRRRFELKSAKLAVAEVVSESRPGMRFLSWFTVVDGKGYVFAGRAPASSFARHRSRFLEVLQTLAPAAPGRACAPTLVWVDIPAKQLVGQGSRDPHLWLLPTALDEKLDFEGEARRKSADGVCDITVKPTYQRGRNAPSQLELTAKCSADTTLSRVVSNLAAPQ